MRGRWPAGVEYIDKLVGSAEDKQRLKAILDTLSGERRVLEACAQLALGETRFHQLREMALQAALTALTPRPAGRPRRTVSAQAEEIHRLRQRIQELEGALQVAQVREEIALVLPHRRPPEPDGHQGPGPADEKKTRRRQLRIAKAR